VDNRFLDASIGLCEPIDDSWTATSDAELRVLIENALMTDPSGLNELYLKNPGVYLETLGPRVPSLTIDVLSTIFPYSEFLCFDGASNEQVTVYQKIEILIQQKHFQQAKRFGTDFGMRSDVDKLIQKYMQTKAPSRQELLSIARLFPDGHFELPDDARVRKNEVDESFSVEISGDSYDEILGAFRKIKRMTLVNPSLMSIVLGAASKFIMGTVVDSCRAELITMTRISRLIRHILLFKVKMRNLAESAQLEAFFIQLQILRRFMKVGFFGRFGEPYSLSNFASYESGLAFASLAQKYDQTDLKLDIQRVWHVGTFAHAQALNCFKLGLLGSGLEELRTAVQTLKVLKIDRQPLANDLVEVLTHPPTIDVESLFRGKLSSFDSLVPAVRDEETISFPSLWRVLSQTVAEGYGIIVDSPQTQALDQAFEIIEATEQRILHLCKMGQFDVAFEAFSGFAGHLPNRSMLFLRLILTPAVAYSQWNVFLRRFFRRLDAFAPILRDLFSFLKQNHMYLCLFDLQRGAGVYDEALLAGIEALRTATTWEAGLEILINLANVVGNVLATPQAKRTLTDSQLRPWQHKLALQMAIWEHFAGKHRPFTPRIGLLGSPADGLRLAANLLISLELGYFQAVCELPEISSSAACDVAVSEPSLGGCSSLQDFFERLTTLDSGLYRMIVQEVAFAMHKSAADPMAFVAFVCANVRGIETQAKILVKTGMAGEVQKVAGSRTNKKLIEAIKTCMRKEK
jgi:hypothetical protein